ncbi:MAG: hypothetical protein DMD35_06560 [Gemmatimonadetes bacterium]|nr:MAG: hypothetical protein DMD35_06560 [Gemmatimonadota bacterium]
MELEMSKTRSRAARTALLASLGGAILLLSGAASSSHAAWFKGGPWISIETPINPYDVPARGALFLVHTFHHAVPTNLTVEARAEGLVDGKRRTVPLSPSALRTGTFAVRNEWGARGTWSVLIVATQPEPKASIQAVVDVGTDGGVSRVTLPQRMMTAADVDRSLRERAGAPVTVGAR